MKDLKFKILLDDQYTSKMKSIASTSNKSFKQLARDIKRTGKLGGNLDGLNNKLDYLEKKRRVSVDVSEMKRITKEIRKVNREIDLVERKSGMRKGKTGGGAGLAAKAGGMIAGAGIAYGAVSLGSEIVQTSAKYEKFEAILKTSYGSSLKAKQAMIDLQGFASGTPFQIDELTDSFIKLKSQGFTPTMSEMTKLGDVAASKGKSFEQLSEAMLDAQMGEFERLKEFGIKGSSKGKKYTFTFKGKTTEIEKSSDAVKDYILSLGKLNGVQGSMNAISKTTGGQLSNLSDNWDQLKNVIGKTAKGPVNWAVSGLSSLVGKVKEWFTVPLSQELREEKADFNALVGAITDTNTTTDERSQLLNQLQEQYPSFLGDLDKESVKNEQLLKRLDAVNASYEKKIKLQSASEVVEYDKQLLDEAKSSKIFAQTQLQLIKQAKAGSKSAEQLLRSKAGFISGASLNKLEEIYSGIVKGSTGLISQRQQTLEKSQAFKKSASIEDFIEQKDKELKEGKKSKLFDKESYEKLKKSLLYIGKTKLAKGKATELVDFGGLDIQEISNMETASKFMSQIDAMFNSGEKKVKKIPFGKTGGKSTKLDSGVDEIAGDNRIAKNLTINIDNLMNGDIEIITETLKEGSAEVKQHILDALLAAVNDVNGA